MRTRTTSIPFAPRLLAVDWLRLMATFLLSMTVLLVAIDVVIWAGQRFRPPPVSFIQGHLVFVFEMFYAISYAAMGWLLATRLSRNILGWLFLALGVMMAAQLFVTFTVQQGHQAFRPLEPIVLLGAWLTSSVHLPMMVLVMSLVYLLFPTGRALSPRWALTGWLTAAGVALVVLGVGLSPDGLAWFPSLPNMFAAPLAARTVLAGIALVGLVLMVVGSLGATASILARYRRSSDVQRAQLRWIAIAVLFLAGSGVPFLVVRYGLQADYASGHLLLSIAMLAGCFLPVAAAIAVLRHRLYDIDLILNRALVYIPLTAVLGGMYTGGVALFQRLFVAITGDRSDAAIVITTLVLASLFTPVRNSLQSFVDRRFKPGTPAAAGPVADEELTLEQRVATLEQRLSRMEIGSDARADW